MQGVLAGRSVMAAVATALLLTLVSGEARQDGASGTITLAWDPNPEPDIAGYVVHVGLAPSIYHERLDVGRVTSFTYTGGLPGRRYYFAVSAYVDGSIEGPLSAEVSGIATAAVATETRRAANCTHGTDACTSGVVLARDLGPVRSLAALDDGRVMLVEDDRVVRMLSSDGRLHLALASARADMRYTSVVADPRFDLTRFVYVGFIEPGRDESQFNIARYRELDGVLGEGAVLISGLRFAEGEPRFSLDPAGRIYVAMPGGARDFYAGRVLRFNADGSASGTVGSTPVLVEGHPIPLALGWAGSTMWVAGGNRESTSLFGIDVGRDGRISESPIAAAVASSIGVAGPVPRLSAFAARDVRHGDRTSPMVVWVDEQGAVVRAGVADVVFERPTAQTLAFDGTPRAVTISPDGDVYVALTDESRSTVLRLSRPDH